MEVIKLWGCYCGGGGTGAGAGGGGSGGGGGWAVVKARATPGSPASHSI